MGIRNGCPLADILCDEKWNSKMTRFTAGDLEPSQIQTIDHHELHALSISSSEHVAPKQYACTHNVADIRLRCSIRRQCYGVQRDARRGAAVDDHAARHRRDEHRRRCRALVRDLHQVVQRRRWPRALLGIKQRRTELPAAGAVHPSEHGATAHVRDPHRRDRRVLGLRRADEATGRAL